SRRPTRRTGPAKARPSTRDALSRASWPGLSGPSTSCLLAKADHRRLRAPAPRAGTVHNPRYDDKSIAMVPPPETATTLSKLPGEAFMGRTVTFFLAAIPFATLAAPSAAEDANTIDASLLPVGQTLPEESGRRANLPRRQRRHQDRRRRCHGVWADRS